MHARTITHTGIYALCPHHPHVQVLRNVFHLSPSLSKEQFFSTSFAERKLILLADVLRCCQQTHTKLAGERG